MAIHPRRCNEGKTGSMGYWAGIMLMWWWQMAEAQKSELRQQLAMNLVAQIVKRGKNRN